MFLPLQSLLSCAAHASGAVALVYYLFQYWPCDYYWYIFGFCSAFPGFMELMTMLGVACFHVELWSVYCYTNSKISNFQKWYLLLFFNRFKDFLKGIIMINTQTRHIYFYCFFFFFLRVKLKFKEKWGKLSDVSVLLKNE